MSDAELQRLEREAGEARSRLVGSLASLRSNDQISKITARVSDDIEDAKEELVSKVRGTARDRADGILADIKARVAANPGAALAIGAGLAWRLYRHPPVATMLVGAGVTALLRTDPRHPAPGSHMAARATHLAGSARDRIRDKADEWREGDPAGQMGDLAQNAREQIGNAREQIGDLAGSAKEAIGAFAETTRERIGEWSSDASVAARRGARQATQTAGAWSASGRQAVAGAMPEANRDKILLGAAALALAAAVGIAGQRRATGRKHPKRK